VHRAKGGQPRGGGPGCATRAVVKRERLSQGHAAFQLDGLRSDEGIRDAIVWTPLQLSIGGAPSVRPSARRRPVADELPYWRRHVWPWPVAILTWSVTRLRFRTNIRVMRKSRELTSEEELLLAARGDADAFARFYRQHAEAVLGFLAQRLRDPELAADVCAETFAAALIDARRFDPDAGTATAWLYGIARHKLVDAQRRGRAEDRARRRLAIPPLELTDEALERIENLAELIDSQWVVALDDLPPSQQDAVRARVLQERSYAEIAAEHATTEANVRQRVARGLARLRRRVQEEPR
jgi:RNA polymerase sigma-70 factor, ECF subfamily